MNTRKPEPVPSCQEQIDINPATATQVQVATLQQSLFNVGLTCEQTSDAQLQQFIQDVRGTFPPQQPGDSQGFFIGTRTPGLAQSLRAEAGQFLDAVTQLEFNSRSHARVADAASLPDAANFYRRILEDNPGGVQYVNQLSKATWEESDAAGFAQDLARDNPNAVIMLVKLGLKDIAATATADWVPGDGPFIGKWSDDLSDLINQNTFNCLAGKSEKSDRYDCRKGQQPDKRWGQAYTSYYPYTDDLSTADAVKTLYGHLADNITAAVVTGVDHPSLEACLSNALAAMPATASDYDSQKNGVDPEVVIFFADNPVTQGGRVTDCDGAGVIAVKWRLQVKEYKSKKHKTHTTNFEAWTRALFYPSVYSAGSNPTLIGDQLSDDCILCP